MKSGNRFRRVALAAVLCLTFILSGCSTDWVGQAEQIVAVMIPAATNVVALVAAVGGKDVSASDLEAIQRAGAQAGSDLQLIQSLILAYQKADEAAKPGILNQIQSGINTVQGNLQGLMAALHIKDAATQAKVSAVVGIVLSEVQSLAAIVPIVKGDAQNSKAVFAAAKISANRAPLSANQFVAAYNSTLTARTGNAGLDRMTADLQIHLHGKVQRIASAGALK
jgi:hypothetical protein